MNKILISLSSILLLWSCELQGKSSTASNVLDSDSTATIQELASFTLPDYNNIVYTNKEILAAAPGTKSVIFNAAGDKLYAMNLEGMSIYEFDRATRKVIKEYKFKPTPGTGWDYEKDKPIKSYEEKPVEAALSHQDAILWVSLHNAAGIVPIHVKDITKNKKQAGPNDKTIYVKDNITNKIDTIFVPLIKTGKTPKVIAVSGDNEHLMVSNWHSYNVSVLDINATTYPFGNVTHTIPVSSIPRGIVIDDKAQKSYVSIMGGASLAVIDNQSWTSNHTLKVASNPRHVVQDNDGRLFVSYNKLGQIAAIDPVTEKTLFTASTHAQPRTIMLSKNKKFLFVTCYNSNYVDIFKIEKDKFVKVIDLPCPGKPVGVDIYESEDYLEAWVCSYTTGSITIYKFDKEK